MLGFHGDGKGQSGPGRETQGGRRVHGLAIEEVGPGEPH